jgi:hypothetical protein
MVGDLQGGNPRCRRKSRGGLTMTASTGARARVVAIVTNASVPSGIPAGQAMRLYSPGGRAVLASGCLIG